ncbi:MAG: glycine dehydrogenase, partial [Ktedonobacteraceae bacterium]
ELCLQKAHYAFRQITSVPGFTAAFSSPFFNEFVIESPVRIGKLQQQFEQAGLIGGYPLAQEYPAMPNTMLFCVTETRTKAEIDLLVATLKEVQA